MRAVIYSARGLQTLIHPNEPLGSCHKNGVSSILQIGVEVSAVDFSLVGELRIEHVGLVESLEEVKERIYSDRVNGDLELEISESPVDQLCCLHNHEEQSSFSVSAGKLGAKALDVEVAGSLHLEAHVGRVL